MVKNIGPNLDVQRLMHEIRASVSSQHQNPQNVSSDSTPPAGSNFSPASQYQLNDLLKFHGDDFVRNAYRALLGRDADEAGMKHHLDALASGHFNKIDVVAGLLSSPEGQHSKVKVTGLWFPFTVRRLGRLPLIGYFIRLIVALARLPRLVRYQSQFEFYTWSQQKQIMDHQNQGFKELNESLNQISPLVKSVQRSQETMTAKVQELESMMAARLSEISNHADQSTAKLNAISQQVHDHNHLFKHLEAETRQLLNQQQDTQEQMRPIVMKQQRTDVELLTQERRLTVLLEQVRKNTSNSSPAFAHVAANEEEHLIDALYASLEDHLRGPRDEVRERLKVYVPILKEAGITGEVLDIGCGRGEWLELMHAEGIEARGVDNNRIVVEQCRSAGLKVVEEDALVHLRSLPDESLDAVTTFHLVEHLPFETLVRLLNEIVRTLKPEGILIVETPNPENFMVASCSFYADPTHRNPIPIQTLRFLLESRGLTEINVLRLRPWDAAKIEGDSELIKRFNEYFYSAPDYGITAKKHGPPLPASTDVQ